MHPPKNLPVRPTTDMAKESLFNILHNKLDFEGKSVMDLFAGTGSISMEFVSQGCRNVLAVDNNQRCINWIRNTAKSFNMQELTALRMDVFRLLNLHYDSFDIIFADPPYDMKEIDKIGKLVFENKLLRPEGFLIVEHSKIVNLSQQPYFVDHRKYGKVNFSFFKFVG